MITKRFEKIVEAFVIVIIFLAPNMGVLLCHTDFSNPLSFCSYKNFSIEITLDVLVVIGAIWIIARNHLMSIFVKKWKNNLPLVLFCVLSALSIIWSVNRLMTVEHLLVLLLVNVLAAFLAVRYSLQKSADTLFAFFGIVVVASIALVIAFPNAAIMGEPHAGSWRGVFWHKNFTGSLMALANAIFLFNLLGSSRKETSKIVVNALLYIGSLVYVVKSLSAAGVATWLILNGLLICLFFWNKFRAKLQRRHYFILLGIVLLLVLVCALNTNLIFKLLNRESSLTGRMPLWTYLINSTVSQRPAAGYGLGGIWSLPQFRQQVTLSQGWGFEINNAHNGFMDMLLDLGILGVLLVLSIYILAFIRTWKYFYRQRSFEAVFPLLIVTYTLWANLSIAFILENESFHWLLLILALMITTPPVEAVPVDEAK
jgi:O-antigen ligase